MIRLISLILIATLLSSGDCVAESPEQKTQKPNISAPGSTVFSAPNDQSGTSMASPHVAGSIAMMLAASMSNNDKWNTAKSFNEAIGALEKQRSTNGLPWGIERVKRAEIGSKGNGIVVAVIDTGVDASAAWRGGQVRGWSSEPPTLDSLGHGTHCAGTISENAMGITPGAYVMSFTWSEMRLVFASETSNRLPANASHDGNTARYGTRIRIVQLQLTYAFVGLFVAAGMSVIAFLAWAKHVLSISFGFLWRQFGAGHPSAPVNHSVRIAAKNKERTQRARSTTQIRRRFS